jgi:hypothetical protein
MPWLLARRVEALPTVVLVTYRDGLERIHPLRVLLGGLPSSPSVLRLRLEPSSLAAVQKLAADRGIEPTGLYVRSRARTCVARSTSACAARTQPG